MQFGLFYLPTYLPTVQDAQTHYQRIIDQVAYADTIGIDSVWFAEHHFVRHGGLCAAPYTLLAYLAARTTRIRLGTGATILPLHDPVRVAEQAATLDQLSQGRFDFGIGRGFLRDEFEAFGIDMQDSRARLEEGVALITRAWTQPTLASARPWRPSLPDLPLLPPVYQQPHPPIWVACLLSRDSFVWAAREGYHLLYVAYHVEPAVAAERIGWYRTALRAQGRRVEDYAICCMSHAHFLAADDDARLQQVVHPAMQAYAAAGLEAAARPPDPTAYPGYDQRDAGQRRFDFATYFPSRVLMGGPQQAIARITALKALGITQIAMLVDFGALPHAAIMDSLAIFARDILPHVWDL